MEMSDELLPQRLSVTALLSALTAAQGFKIWPGKVLGSSPCPESPSSRTNVLTEERCERNIRE